MRTGNNNNLNYFYIVYILFIIIIIKLNWCFIRFYLNRVDYVKLFFVLRKKICKELKLARVHNVRITKKNFFRDFPFNQIKCTLVLPREHICKIIN